MRSLRSTWPLWAGIGLLFFVQWAWWENDPSGVEEKAVSSDGQSRMEASAERRIVVRSPTPVGDLLGSAEHQPDAGPAAAPYGAVLNAGTSYAVPRHLGEPRDADDEQAWESSRAAPAETVDIGAELDVADPLGYDVETVPEGAGDVGEFLDADADRLLRTGDVDPIDIGAALDADDHSGAMLEDTNGEIIEIGEDLDAGTPGTSLP